MGQQPGLDKPATYQIQVQGRLGENWSDWFDNMVIKVETRDDGTVVSTLIGPIRDQAALHGILRRIRDLGLPLLEVKQGCPR
jgi:hypothetical protein